MTIHCWKCRKIVSQEPMKIGFRAQCGHCGADLHTCTNCRYYCPGKPNDCLVPGTETVKDREAMNFCEEYAFKPPSNDIPHADSFLNKEKEKDNFNKIFKDID